MKNKKEKTAAAAFSITLFFALFFLYSCSPDVLFICERNASDYSPLPSACPDSLDFSISAEKPDISAELPAGSNSDSVREFLFSLIEKELSFCRLNEGPREKHLVLRENLKSAEFSQREGKILPVYAELEIKLYGSKGLLLEKNYSRRLPEGAGEKEAMELLAQAMLEMRADIIKAASAELE